MAGNYTDAQLLRRAKRDPEAFRVIFERHAPQIRRWLLSRTSSDAAALDLTAEVFAQAWVARKRFKAPEDGSAGPWLQGIARNLLYAWLRDARAETVAREQLRMQTVDRSESLEEQVVARLGSGELRDSALAHLAALPADQREAVTLRVIEELPYEEIARKLDCTAAAARVRVMRGLRRLNANLNGGLA